MRIMLCKKPLPAIVSVQRREETTSTRHSYTVRTVLSRPCCTRVKLAKSCSPIRDRAASFMRTGSSSYGVQVTKLRSKRGRTPFRQR